MSRKFLFLFLGMSWLTLNELNAEFYECYLATDLKKEHPLGKNPIRGLGEAGESLCKAEHPQECTIQKCLFKSVERPQRQKFF